MAPTQQKADVVRFSSSSSEFRVPSDRRRHECITTLLLSWKDGVYGACDNKTDFGMYILHDWYNSRKLHDVDHSAPFAMARRRKTIKRYAPPSSCRSSSHLEGASSIAQLPPLVAFISDHARPDQAIMSPPTKGILKAIHSFLAIPTTGLPTRGRRVEGAPLFLRRGFSDAFILIPFRRTGL